MADETTPQMMPERDMRRLIAKQLAGVPFTPEEATALAGHTARQQQVSDKAADTGWEMTGVPGVARAAQETWNDPSLANATNLGARTAMTAFRPLAAAGIMAGGLGIGAARDAGMFGGSAEAAGLSPEDKVRAAAVRKQLAAGKFANGAERRALEREDAKFSEIEKAAAIAGNTKEIEADAEKKKADQAEYSRAVTGAERARDTELARNRRFSDTEVGKVWDKAGGWGPFVVGAGMGGLTRLAGGGGSVVKDHILPILSGTVGGAASTNIPLAYNAFNTEPDNPEKRAYEAYARELPQGHPRKQEYADYARGLPEANPVRKAAAGELYDWDKAKERMVFGGLEGLGGGLAGAEGPTAIRNIVNTLAGTPGMVAEGFYNGMKGAHRASREAAKAEAKAVTARQGVQELRDVGSQVRGVGSQVRGVGQQEIAGTAEAQRRIGGPAGSSGQFEEAVLANPQRQPSASSNPASSPPVSNGTELTAAPMDAQLLEIIKQLAGTKAVSKASTPRLTAKQQAEAAALADADAAAAAHTAEKKARFQNLFGGN